MTSNDITERIKSVGGIAVHFAGVADDNETRDVFCDEKNDRTVFTVRCGDECLAFSIDGTGDDKLVIARLAREIAVSPLAKHDGGKSAIRDFLCGNGQEPTVRVGKSDYYVFAVYCKTRSKAVFDYLSAMACGDDFVADMKDGITALCKRSDDDYRSAGEFAVVLRENLAEEIDENIKIGVGGVAHGLSELPVYYGYARSALLSGAEFDPKSDVYSYKEYALIRVLSELPASVTERYVKTVLEKNYREVLTDEELMTAADAFIKHSLNISEASRSMYVHRNTLIYRIDKIEKMTGLNIRNFNDAMSLRVAYLISKSL